jgi:hypothetical protein
MKIKGVDGGGSSHALWVLRVLYWWPHNILAIPQASRSGSSLFVRIFIERTAVQIVMQMVILAAESERSFLHIRCIVLEFHPRMRGRLTLTPLTNSIETPT